MLNKTIRRDMFPNMTWVASETCSSQSGLAPFANRMLQNAKQEDITNAPPDIPKHQSRAFSMTEIAAKRSECPINSRGENKLAILGDT
jgi:hypothetical protein